MKRPLPDTPGAARARDILLSERGLTLSELMVVGILAIVVMLGLTGFYFNAQRMWLQSSTQAMTQRDATLLMDAVGEAVHQSWGVSVDQSNPAFHRLSLLRPPPGNVLPWVEFAVDDDDGRVHRYEGGNDLGPVTESEVLQFRFDQLDTNIVVLELAELKSHEGDTVRVSSRFQLLGR